MKTNINNVLTSVEEAEQYLKDLFTNDEAYHPEDDAQDIIFGFDVTKAERTQMNMRMDEVWYFIPDPCGIIVKLLAEKNTEIYAKFNAEFEKGSDQEGQDPEYYADILDDPYTHPTDVL